MPFMNNMVFKEFLESTKKLAAKLFFFRELLRENNICEFDTFETIEDFFRFAKEKREDLEIKKFEKSLTRTEIYSIDDIDLMEGVRFENFLKTLFEKMGYMAIHTKLSGDQGADLVISKAGEITVVQAKRSKSSIGNKAVQEIVASINYYKAQKAMVITNNEFTSSAIELAKSNNVILLNREELIRLIKEYLY